MKKLPVNAKQSYLGTGFCAFTGANQTQRTSRGALKSREKFLAVSEWTDSAARKIRSGFLGEEDRGELIALARGLRLAA
jgi:hypothetical protein